MENSNWGSNSIKKDKNSSSNWGDKNHSYHRTYANAMNIFLIIQVFIIPAITWVLISAVLLEAKVISNSGPAFVGYIVTAAILWFNLSYKAKLFDNISRLAKNSEDIIKAIENQRKDD
jgi:hypothetical protein